MTEYARAGGATTAYEAAGSGPLSVPAHRPGGPPRRPILAVTGTPGPGRLEMTGGARRCPRGQVPGTVVPLMLTFSQSDAARA
jgi:hypothetical protein